MAVCCLLWIFRILKIKTLGIILLSCTGAIAILTLIEKICKNKQSTNQTDVQTLLDQGSRSDSFWSEQIPIRYDLRPFDLHESPDESGVCGVCLQKIKEGSEAAILPCMHSFHPKCIEKWAKVRNTCPSCKSSLL